MTEDRLAGYVDQMRRAAVDACSFVEAMARDEFLRDKRTQQAVVMSLLIVGEAATKVLDRYPDFVRNHAAIPWRSMRGMRNRIAHGYFEIDLDVVWETVRVAVPELLRHLPEES